MALPSAFRYTTNGVAKTFERVRAFGDRDAYTTVYVDPSIDSSPTISVNELQFRITDKGRGLKAHLRRRSYNVNRTMKVTAADGQEHTAQVNLTVLNTDGKVIGESAIRSMLGDILTLLGEYSSAANAPDADNAGQTADEALTDILHGLKA